MILLKLFNILQDIISGPPFATVLVFSSYACVTFKENPQELIRTGKIIYKCVCIVPAPLVSQNGEPPSLISCALDSGTMLLLLFVCSAIAAKSFAQIL